MNTLRAECGAEPIKIIARFYGRPPPPGKTGSHGQKREWTEPSARRAATDLAAPGERCRSHSVGGEHC